MVSMSVFSLMDKQAPGKHTRWLVKAVLFLVLWKWFFKEIQDQYRCSCPALKFISKQFVTCCSLKTLKTIWWLTSQNGRQLSLQWKMSKVWISWFSWLRIIDLWQKQNWMLKVQDLTVFISWQSVMQSWIWWIWLVQKEFIKVKLKVHRDKKRLQ